MQIGRITGCTQGYLGLPLRDELIDCTVNGPDTNSMVTAWLPTPDEIARINAGAPVHLRVLGDAHPPVMLDVGEVPCADDPIDSFLADCTERDDQATVSASDLYHAYLGWLERMTPSPVPRSQFAVFNALIDRGYRRSKNTITRWLGLKLKEGAAS